MAYSLTSLVDKVRQTLGGAVAQAPATLAGLGDRVSSNFNWAGQQAQQGASSFGKTLSQGLNTFDKGVTSLSNNPNPLVNFMPKAITSAANANIKYQQAVQSKPITFSKSGLQNYIDQQRLKLDAGLKTASPVLDVALAPTVGAATYLGSAGIGAAFGAGSQLVSNITNKRNPFENVAQSAGYGAQQGLVQAPKISTIAGITNPVINQAAGKVLAKFPNLSEVGKAIVNRVVQGTLSVPEGIAMAKATGQDYNLTNAAIDFAVGSGLAKKAGTMAIEGPYGGGEAGKIGVRTPDQIRSDKLLVAIDKALSSDRLQKNSMNPKNFNDIGDLTSIRDQMIKGVDNAENQYKANYILDKNGLSADKSVGSAGFAKLNEPIGKVSENPQALTGPSQPQQTQPRTIQDQSPSVVKPGGALAVESSSYFNTDRLAVSDKAKATVSLAIEDVKPQIEAKVGKKLTNKEVIDVANNTASVLDRSVSRAETQAWEAKMLKARQQLAQQATDGTVTEDFINNLVAIKSQGTDIARKMQSLSIGAAPGEITAKQAILEAVMKVTDNVDEIIAKSKGVDFNNYEQASQFYRQFVKPKASDWVDMIRYSSMLSSPNTHINNFSSNAQGTGIIAPVEKTIAGGVDWFLSAVNPNRERTRFVGEGVAYSKGYGSKLGEAWTNFKETLSGKKMSSMQELHNIPLTEKGTVGRAAENTLSYPGKLLQAADEFFQTLTSGGVESQLKYRESKGLKVRDIQGQAYLEARKRLFNSEFGLKEDGPVLKALEFIPMKVAEARASSNPVISTIAKYSFPFVKIPSNLLKASVEYSPAGLATIPGAGDKITQLTKAMLGTAVGIGTAALVGSDRMTWAEPADPTKKALFRAAGMQPYSVKIGDSWYSYSKMHPAISFNMALVAAIRDSEKNQLLNSSQVDTALEGAAKWVNFYADQSYVKNIGDMVSATKGDAEAITRGLSNYPQQLVPFRALLGWVAKIIDPYQRKVDTDGSFLTKQIQQLMTQIPGLSQSVPARLGPNDVPIENTNRLWNAVSPVRATTEDPTNKAAYDVAVLKSKATRQKNADKKAAYVNSSDAPQNILDTVGTYGKSVITDPGQTINAVLAGNPIRKVAGGAVILERKQGLGAMDKGNKATQVDHIIALTLGGTNSKDNLQVLTNQENMIKGQIETHLYKLMKSGEITKEEAQKRDLNWRNEVAILPKNIQEQLVTDLSTPEVKKTKQSTLKVKTPKAPKGTSTGKAKAGKRITVKVAKVPKIKTIKIKRFTPKIIKSKPLKLKKYTVSLNK